MPDVPLGVIRIERTTLNLAPLDAFKYPTSTAPSTFSTPTPQHPLDNPASPSPRNESPPHDESLPPKNRAGSRRVGRLPLWAVILRTLLLSGAIVAGAMIGVYASSYNEKSNIPQQQHDEGLKSNLWYTIRGVEKGYLDGLDGTKRNGRGGMCLCIQEM